MSLDHVSWRLCCGCEPSKVWLWVRRQQKGDEADHARQEQQVPMCLYLWRLLRNRISSDTQDEVFTSSWIKKLEVLVGDAKISRATQMSRVGKLEAQHCEIMSVGLVWRSLVDHATAVSAGI